MARFHQEIEKWKHSKSTALSDIQNMSVEELFAFLEVSSKLGNFEGLDLQQWMDSASEKEIAKLVKDSRKKISTWDQQKSSTEKSQQDLISQISKDIEVITADLIRATMLTKISILDFLTLTQIENLKLKLNDEVLTAYFRNKLINENIQDVLWSAGIIKSKTKLSRFYNFAKSKSKPIARIFGLALNLVLLMNRQLPPFVGSPKILDLISAANPSLKDGVIKYGYRNYLKTLQSKLGSAVQAQWVANYISSAYSIVAGLLLVGFVHSELIQHQEDNQKAAEQAFVQKENTVDRKIEQAQKSPEEKLEAMIDEYIQNQQAKGIKLTKDSAEVVSLKQILRDSMIEVAKPAHP